MEVSTLNSSLIFIFLIVYFIKIFIHLKYFSLKAPDKFKLEASMKTLNPFNLNNVYFFTLAILPIPIVERIDNKILLSKKKLVNILVLCIYLLIVALLAFESNL
jgi:hypothetical protein